MRTTSSHARHRSFLQIAALALTAALGSLTLSACGGEPAADEEELESIESALTESQCNSAVPKTGTALICHYASGKFTPTKVTRSQCCTHGKHSADYIAGSDTKCVTTCRKADIACDSVSKCCAGLTCTSGKCKPAPACMGAGAACSTGDPLKCCSKICNCLGGTCACTAP